MLIPACNPSSKFLIVMAGPTAVGKTAAAITLASHYNIPVISADSRQFYRELKIGVASPTPNELSLTRHYFVGHLSVGDYYNVSRFETDTLKLLDKLFVTHDIALLVGGSGLYIDAVCRGIDDLPDPDWDTREIVKKWYEQHGIDFLREKLLELDPAYFEQVDKHNPNRMMRAIEVCLATGTTYSSLRKNKAKTRDFNIIKTGLNLPRATLFENISRRTDKMISEGLIEEVKGLLKFRHLNALKTVGYKEIFEYLDGNIPLDQAIENIKTNTRRYAKRQLTWFKRDTEITWFSPQGTDQMIDFINSLMKTILQAK